MTGYGIDHDDWTPFDLEKLPIKSRQLLLVAARKKHKNFEMAIAAFRRAQIDPAWTLRIVTPDDKLRSVIDIAPLIGIDGRVVLDKAVTNSALRDLYADSTILLMPSRYEGFGLPLLEGMQAGAQCISSTADALIEVGLGGHVIYVNAEDHDGWIRAIEQECARFDRGDVSDAERKANMRVGASFCWDAVAHRTAEQLQAVIEDR